MAAKTNEALTCSDMCCNITRNLNLVHIIRTHTEHYHYAEIKCTHMRHIIFAKIRIIIENTPRSMATDFSHMIGLNSLLQMWVAKFTHHTGGSFLRNCNLFFFIGILTV